eukprot:m.229555 g.229555  ORF g.229555 m.229555 type:complete len:2216 (-) comp17054_c0_seq1:44-6691(-)
MRTATFLVAAVLILTAAASVLAGNERPLFPLAKPNAALNGRIDATSTCGFPPSTFCTEETSACLSCNSTCPNPPSNATIVPPSLTLPQPECTCTPEYPYAIGSSTCCTSPAGTSCIPRLNIDAHPVELAVDAYTATYFQSELNVTHVNVTLDLLIPHETTTISLSFIGRVPYAMAIYKSVDNINWEPFQYFAQDCSASFGLQSDKPVESADEVICETTQTSPRNDEILFRPLSNRRIQLDGGDYATATLLQQFVTTRYLRLVMAQYYTAETAVDDFGLQYDHEPTYRISVIQVQGRCNCNGHSDICVTEDGSATCECEHNTQGQTCNECEPLYYGKPWARGVSNGDANVCVACNCNDHALSCHYDATVDEFPTERSRGNGGVCDNCMHNTTGVSCETCLEGFFENPTVPRNATNACLPCQCDAAGATASSCNVKTGMCSCKQHVTGPTCGSCKPGFYDLSASHDTGCIECACVNIGTVNASFICDEVTGQCPCLESNQGRTCAQCKTGYYRPLLAEAGVCRACHPQCSSTDGCSGPGSSIAICNGKCRHFEEDGVCVEKCGDFRYPDANGVCRSCNQECFGGCNSSAPTTTSCFSCRNFEEDGVCVASCSTNSYADANDVCHACDDQCIGCVGPTPSQCKACRSVRFNGVCVDACPSGTYANSNRDCLACHPQCSSTDGCSGPGASVGTCNDHCRNFEQDGICVASCADFHYADGNGVCHLCNQECLGGCNSSDATTSSCFQCRNFEEQGVCVPTCRSNAYVDASDVCQSCHSQCLGCVGPAADQCKACRNVHLNGVCLESCPVGTYADASRECQPCNAQCVESRGCTGPEAYQCLECANVYDLSYPTVAFTCRQECPARYYVSKETLNGVLNASVCRSCHAQCAFDCMGPGADQCVGGCRAVSYNGKCVASCPSHTYRDGSTCLPCHPNCQSSQGCTGPARDQCSQCRPEAVSFETECLSGCPQGYFADQDRICQPCDSACRTCFGPTADQCFRCTRYRYGDQCVDDCPSSTTYPVAVDGDQTSTSQPFTDFDSSGVDNTFATARPPRDNETLVAAAFECLECHEQCAPVGCVGPSASQCNRCANVQYRGICMQTCPPDTYRDGQVCRDCSLECENGCYGPGPSDCVSCRDLLLERTCVSNCPTDHLQVNNTCLPCHSYCSTETPGCKGLTASDCIACASNRVRIVETGECVVSCPRNLYATQDGECQPCHEECLGGCTGPLASLCTACKNFELDGECVPECPSGFFSTSSGICQACDPLCAKECSGSGPGLCRKADDATSECLVAKRNGVCVSGCDPLTEYMEEGECKACSSSCAFEGCTGPTNRDCTACRAVILDGSCVDQCPLTHYQDATGICRRCNSECTSYNGTRFCSGPGADACTSCMHVKRDRTCLGECRTTEVAVAGICRSCHAQCSGTGCYGIEATQCFACRNFNYNGVCVAQCNADSTYTSTIDQTCRACHSECSTRAGSGGCPSGTGPSDCVVCSHVRDNGVCVGSCPTGFYADATDTATALGGVCKACHPTCNPLQGCVGGRADQCNACANFIYQGQCVNTCPAFTYADNRVCRDCDVNCLTGCTGAGADQCKRAANIVIPTAEALGCRSAVDITNGVVSCVSACFLGKYRDSDGVCQACSTLCPIELGCTGPSEAGCNSCGSTEYLLADRTCAACSTECSQVLGASGCLGPDPADCVACSRARFNGDCVDDCDSLTNVAQGIEYFTDTSNPLEAVCRRCHSECALGGCTGTGPDKCLAGCKNYAIIDGSTGVQTCVASCGSNMFVVDTPHPRTCTPCHSRCRDGCTDATAFTCTRCARFRTQEGECVDTCPTGWVPVNGMCTCPADRSYLTSAGQCFACHAQCAAGCTGPEASQCKGGSAGCAFAELDGVCVATCPAGMVKEDSQCVCKENYFRQGSICIACNEECVGGCTGPTASDCLACRKYVSGSACVGSCDANEHPDGDGFCQPCHSECVGGCTSPRNPLSCVQCRSFKSEDRCVSTCPNDRFFLISPNECVPACPNIRPYYNDTRPAPGTEPAYPQRCAVSCAEFGTAQTFINSAEPFRCSTEERVQADLQLASSQSEASISQTSLVVIIAAGVVCVLIIVMVIVLAKKRDHRAAISPVSPKAAGKRTHMNAMYQSSPRAAVGASGSRSLASAYSMDASNYYDVANRSSDSDYLETYANVGGDDSYLEVKPANPYSMSDQALFDSLPSSNVQSTRM